ncbi:MAG: polysaccharide biosynthesis protein [Bacteroidales bacterium]|nr:polysaccharide biosynthesis protein [Bacteroidales bacterium]MBP5214759.1 polysaccharide biosynthesis protein [Bacteroidales bacterium]
MKWNESLQKTFGWYFNKNVLPYWCILLLDTIVVFLSYLFAYWVSNRTSTTYENRFALFYTALFFSALSWVGARIFKTYSGVVRYSSFVDLMKVANANVVTLMISIICLLAFQGFGVTALSALSPLEMVAALAIATLLMWGIRITVKMLFDNMGSKKAAKRALIYGALTGGVGMAKAIRMQNPVQFELHGFITHNHRIKNMRLMGVKVYTLEDDIAAVIEKEQIEAVLVSPLRVNEFRENQKIQDIFINAGCKIYMSQDAREASVKNGELSDDEVENMQLHEVEVEELLPRQEIKVDMESVGKLLSGRRVLITGSAGSIGSEMVRQVAAFKPAKMMLVDQAETPQHDILLMMAHNYPDVPSEVVVTSISNQSRMEHIFETFQPEYVFHAAAYKHVPMMENNPSEAVKNNVYGTKVIADLSVKYGVKKFVMISTDKAVNPTNVMGCSKRICEIYVQSLNRKQKLEAEAAGKKDYTQFVTTRFGNVLGSNGSVIPLFKEQIKRGGPVTVTDERIVRFFMLIPEACKLVLEAGTKGNGGEIFVFDMGDPVKIADLAKRMIALSGAKNVEIKFTGLREGEKLYEEVLNELEGTKPSFHEKIRIASVREYDYEKAEQEIEDLVEVASHFDNMETVRIMKRIVPEYKSNNSVYEVLDKA